MMHSIVGRQGLAGCKPCVQFVGNFLLSIKLCTVFSTAVVSPVGCPQQITRDSGNSIMISHSLKTSNIPDRVGVVHYILQEVFAFIVFLLLAVVDEEVARGCKVTRPDGVRTADAMAFAV